MGVMISNQVSRFLWPTVYMHVCKLVIPIVTLKLLIHQENFLVGIRKFLEETR